jgi:hypothetical protein
LDLLPTKGHSTQEFAYLAENTRTNNTAVVTDGAVKPTSVYGVTRVVKSLEVVAHISEGFNRFWMADDQMLMGFLQIEMLYGLSRAVESLVLGIIDAASIQMQAYATSPLTLRKALTKLEIAGYQASGIVISPTDWESVELSSSTINAMEHHALPYDSAARKPYGVPIAVSIAQDDGYVHVLSGGSVAVDTDDAGIQTQWSENSNADDVSRSLVRCRTEGHYSASVYAPQGVVLASFGGGSQPVGFGVKPCRRQLSPPFTAAARYGWP